MERDSTFLSYYSDAPTTVPMTSATRAAANFELSMGQSQDLRAAIGRQRSNTLTRQREQASRRVETVVRSPAPVHPSPERYGITPTDWQQREPLYKPAADRRRPRNAPPINVTPPLAVPRNQYANEPSPSGSFASGTSAEKRMNPPRAAFAAPVSALSSPSSISLTGSPSDEKRLLSPDGEGWAGPENDRMAPAGGEKDLDFWKRFSMVVHQAQTAPPQAKQKSHWLSQQTSRQKRLTVFVSLLALVVLGAIGGGLAYHFTHLKKPPANSSDNPSVHDFTFTHSSASTTRPGIRTLPVGGGGAEVPTGSAGVKRRMQHRKRGFDQ